jgi:short-subunit dehydrogenase
MDKLVVVSGGTKGMGLAILRRFAMEGFDIATCARTQSNVENIKGALSEEFKDINVYATQADLSKRDEVEKFVQFVKSVNKKVHVLVNNAGLFVPGQVHNEEEGQLEFMINTNLYSAYHLTRGFIEEMKQARSGHIFNMCSTASIVAYVNGGSYCISKFALLGMTRVLREELKEFNVKVTAVLPGATLTASWEGTDLPEERFMKAEDVAELVFIAYSLSDRSVVEEILVRPQLGDI